MSSLPEEIIEENILTRLPVKSISRFRCVSRNWNFLFRNPRFIRNHLNHANQINKFNLLVTNVKFFPSTPPTDSILYSVDSSVLSSQLLGHALRIDYPFMTRECPHVIGSCNGLVCIEPVTGNNICIWNPATREYRRLPEQQPVADSEPDFCFFGFGFDCKNDDYKLLRIEESEVTDASLYSLASNSWKELGTVPYDFSFSKAGGVLHNGVLHWVATVHRNGFKSRVVVCFDVSDETFYEVPLPKDILNVDEDEDHDLSGLGIWEGKPCLLHTNRMEDPDLCTLWTMMDNKWSKHLQITSTDRRFYRAPIQSLNNGEILFLCTPTEDLRLGLMSYDPNLERVRDLKIHDFPDLSWAETYIETLVALDTNTYVGQ